jgi:hypothetical protein
MAVARTLVAAAMGRRNLPAKVGNQACHTFGIGAKGLAARTDAAADERHGFTLGLGRTA